MDREKASEGRPHFHKTRTFFAAFGFTSKRWRFANSEPEVLNLQRGIPHHYEGVRLQLKNAKRGLV
jgi:hypothetical protein